VQASPDVGSGPLGCSYGAPIDSVILMTVAVAFAPMVNLKE
jgi:hypothetical protein